MAEALKIYIIAGEPSGDLLGAHLMRSLKTKSPRPIKFYGIGGERMQAEGLASLFPYQELALMGFIEILPHMFNVSARIGSTVEDALAKQPDLVITIDSPGFCRRVVEKLRKERAKAKFVHYVAPTVWAYKPERAASWARLFDHLLALLPFEPPYFEKAGLPCSFVGHPVVAETAPGDGKTFREKYGIDADVPLFCLLPGSRRGELKRHMPVFGRAMTLLAQQYPNLAMAVAVPRHVLPEAALYFEGCPFRAVITASEEDKKNAIAAANLAIVKSGTVALEVAMAGAPMLVAYRVNPISAWAFKRMALTRYVNLVNILEGEEIIPELLQENCRPETIAAAAAELLQNPEGRQRQKERVTAALARLRAPGSEKPSDLAAEIVLKLLG